MRRSLGPRATDKNIGQIQICMANACRMELCHNLSHRGGRPLTLVL